MLLDLSTYGFVKSLKKGAIVLGYHVFSAGVVAALAALAVELGKLQVSHPEYAVYVASAVAAVNVLAVIVKNWLTAINPASSVPVVDEVPVG